MILPTASNMYKKLQKRELLMAVPEVVKREPCRAGREYNTDWPAPSHVHSTEGNVTADGRPLLSKMQ